MDRYEFAAQERRLAEEQQKEMKHTVPGNSRPKFFLFSSIILFFSMTLQIDALGASLPRLTAEAFLEKGAGIFLGEIMEVQVLGQKGNSEYGNVVIRVDEVLEGKVNAPPVNFPYKRQVGPEIVNGYGWDLVARPEIGKKLIIYFGEKHGAYYTSMSGANPIQEIKSFDDPKVKAVRETVRQRHLPR
jgi:hypothetical protein